MSDNTVLVKMFHMKGGDPYNDYVEQTIITGVTEWEEITVDEYDELYAFVNRYNRDQKNSYYNKEVYVLVRNCETQELYQCIADYKEMLKRDEDKRKRAKQAAAKRKATIAAKKKEKELAQLKELQEKYKGNGHV